MMETEEIQTLPAHPQLHDPGLGRFRLQTESGQHGSRLQQRSLGLPAGTAHHDQIVGEADQHTVPTNIP